MIQVNYDRVKGTEEWASFNVNCMKGCAHDCRYCYARFDAIDRFGQIQPGHWTDEIIDKKEVNMKRIKLNGTVMFPTTHDITPKGLEACVKTLWNLLSVGNSVLIVSKPHIACIERVCKEFKKFKKQILFRFTIGAFDNALLAYWEPHAPAFGERFDSLQYAFNKGFQTSVSCEPMLDSDNMVKLFYFLWPYITDSIWIGSMNKIAKRVKIKTVRDKKQVSLIESGQTLKKIQAIYKKLKDDPKVKWKDSIKEMLGLPPPCQPGLDI
jgi:hypothetical protein